MYYKVFFRDKWKISRVFMFSGLYSEPLLAVQNFWKRQRPTYLQNTYCILVLTVWSPTQQDTKSAEGQGESSQFAEVTWSEAGFRYCWTRKVASPLSLYWVMDGGKHSVVVATAMEAGHLTVVWYTSLGCWIMARRCCSGRECDCKSTSQDAHVPKSWGTEEHWKNEQVTQLLELKWLRWSWTGNIKVGYFYSLMG